MSELTNNKKRGRRPKVENTPKNRKTQIRIQNAIKNVQSYFDATVVETTNKSLEDTEAVVVSLILHLPVKSSDVEDGVPLFNSDKFFEKLNQKNKLLHIENGFEKEIDISEKSDEIFIESKPKRKNNNFLSPYGVKVDGSCKYTPIEQSSWIRSTDTKCWWCCHSFLGIPCGIPEQYDIETNIFYLYGCFCSFNCCLTYIITHLEDKKWEKSALLHLLCKKIMGHDEVIKPAPKKELLEDFGGNLTIEEFRNLNRIDIDILDITLPPINSIRPKLEQRNFFQSVYSRARMMTGSEMDSLLEGKGTVHLDEKKVYRIQRHRPIKQKNEEFIKNFLS